VSGTALRAVWRDSIHDIPAADWNALANDQPFTRHEFLAAMEDSGCAAPATGWSAQHLTLHDGRQLVAAAPAYLKVHSWGEFVFDFAWAKAHAEHGLRYYPKLLLAVPFTPATGARILRRDQPADTTLLRQALQAATARVHELRLSSAHALFIDAATADQGSAQEWLARTDCQFHWHNHGYASFDDYLATFTAEKRKKARRERRRVAEQGIEFRTLAGPELDAAMLPLVHELHANTFIAHGHEPYLNLDCFRRLAGSLGDRMLVKLALHGREPVACAIFFRSDDTLYGRYWGASGNYHSLHFEACYYQGIELCLELGLRHFEPGTQGEHKLARGFEPTITHSAHWIAEPAFRQSIAAWLRREQRGVAAYADAAAAHLPFHA
jgi:predicted N-acyltransferase